MKQFLKKPNLMAASILLAACFAPMAHAGIAWDPDGSGSAPIQDLGAFDWSQSSFVAKGGNTAIANFVGINGGSCANDGCSFQVLSHARLGSTTNSTSASNTPSGLNNTYEYTMVMGFYETVTSVLPAGASPFAPFGAASFKADLSKASFLQIYYDNTPDSDALTGSGFSNGQLVYSGKLDNAATGSFALSDDQPVPLDQFGANDYPGQTTSPGSGVNNNIRFTTIAQDMAFFTQVVTSLGINFTNISLGLPYLQVDPSDCFSTIAHASLGVYNAVAQCDTAHNLALLGQTQQPNTGTGGYVPNSAQGNTNLAGTNANPDFVSQTDYNAALNGIPNMPEPSSILMLGVGLLGMFRVASKKRLAA